MQNRQESKVKKQYIYENWPCEHFTIEMDNQQRWKWPMDIQNVVKRPMDSSQRWKMTHGVNIQLSKKIRLHRLNVCTLNLYGEWSIIELVHVGSRNAYYN